MTKKNDKPVSLHPLKPDDGLEALMRTPPPPKDKKDKKDKRMTPLNADMPGVPKAVQRLLGGFEAALLNAAS